MNLKKISPDLYPILFRSIKDPLNILDLNFRILWANEARAQIHQRSVPEMIGKFCYEMFQRRNEPCPECPVKAAFHTGKPSIMDRWVDLPNGSRKWGEVRAYPVFNKSGNIVYAIEIAVDITEKKFNAERQRRYIESLENTMKEMTKGRTEALLGHPIKKDQVSLTERELEVLMLLANGFSNIEIGEVLAISPHTVKSHVIHIYNKLGVKDRIKAAIWASQHKLT